MRKLIVVFLLLPSLTFGQMVESARTDYVPDLPFDAYGKMTVDKSAITVGSADAVYARGKGLMADLTGSNPKLITVDDKSSGVIAARFTRIVYGKMLGIAWPMECNFTLKIQTKEGKYRYTISDFEYVSTETHDGDTTIRVYSPADLFAAKKYYNGKGEPKPNNLQIHNTTLGMLKELTELIEKEMGDEW